MLSAVWPAALPLALALALWALVDLQHFLLIPVLGAMMFPDTIVKPFGAQLAAADLLFLVGLAAWLVAGSLRAAPGPWLTGNRMFLPGLLWVAVNAESLAWSVRPSDTIQFTIQMIEIVVLLPLVFASLPRSISTIKRGLGIYIGLSCLLAVVIGIVWIYHVIDTGLLEGRDLPGLNKNAIGSFVAAGLVLSYTFWLAEKRGAVKLALAIAVLLQIGGLLSTVSRGSMIGAFFAIIVVSLLLRRKRVLTLGVLAVSALVFLGTIGLHSGVDRSKSGSYDSSVVRSYSFHNAIEKIGDRPVLGSGGGTYRDFIANIELPLRDPNNMFLLTLAELGAIGLLALIFLLYRFGRLFVASRNLPEETAVPAIATGAVALSFFVHFQLDVTWTRGTTSLAFGMIGLMLAIRRLASTADDHVAVTARPGVTGAPVIPEPA